ncbi:uncharacterized protein LOC121383526 isoform X6 [Gigantopelta aegis]|uniref:uncharacterized protein LOC121383526 isoform X6 n=1 Tax=Gigantopelta aegis TaxID=1735272 RepID=UPI001B888D8F|nr:uncharacterized protein LOC121383526 isoform X6 [Gigantopelta aegis]
MEKQYSVKFFASFLEALQKVCRDFVDFDDSIELSGYLSLEIDNVKKERYVLSEMLNSSGNVISESYCTKAFKTVRKYQQPSGRENITPRSQTISNRSQAFISESQNQNSSSSMFNYKDHTPDSRMSKQWSQDMYGTNSHMSPLRGSGQQFGDGVGIHGMKSSNQKRSLSTIVIDDPPSNKRGRSDSVPDDKLLSETSSQHGTCKLDTDAMQATFSNSSQSQSTTHLPTTSSSLQHQTNNSIASHSSSQPASESIRLPLPVTIKDEPDIPCVDIDLSELDSADSMGGSDSGSGYPSQEGTSGPYRMAEGSHGAHDQYQNTLASGNQTDAEEVTATPEWNAEILNHFDMTIGKRQRQANYKCDVCDRTYTHLKSLTRHQVSHVYSIMCRKCTLYFKSEDELKSHNKRKHSPTSCNICGKSFFSTARMKHHQRTYHSM